MQTGIQKKVIQNLGGGHLLHPHLDPPLFTGPVHKGVNHVPKAILDRDLKAWFYPLWMQSSFKSGFWNAKKGAILDHDPPRKPDSDDLWKHSSFGTWFMHVHFGNAHWSHARVNQQSRNTILPRSAQILFVIGTVIALLVSAQSSNHKPNQEADHDPKRFLERDSLLCEQAQWPFEVPR